VIHFYGSERPGQGSLPHPKDALPSLSFEGFTAQEPKVAAPDPAIENFMSALNKELNERFAVSLTYRPRVQIARFMQAYVSAAGKPSEALDLQIVSKVIPKIRYSHREDFGESLTQFSKQMEQIWPFEGQRPIHSKRVLELLKVQA
jgi:hypothetical protein